MWYVEEETLSDGSKAYNVSNGECIIGCYSLDDAYELLSIIGTNSVDHTDDELHVKSY